MIFKFNTTAQDIDIWIENNDKLVQDLIELTTKNVPDAEVNAYLEDMVGALRPVKSIDCFGMLYLMSDEPSSMYDADERVQFVYIPTYLAATIMMTAMNRYESVAMNGRFAAALRSVLGAAIGRKFQGAGLEANEGFLVALRIFAAGDTLEFISRYPDINKRFVCAFNDALEYLETEICSGRVKGAWGVDLSEKGKEVLNLYRKAQ